MIIEPICRWLRSVRPCWVGVAFFVAFWGFKVKGLRAKVKDVLSESPMDLEWGSPPQTPGYFLDRPKKYPKSPLKGV